MISDHGDQSLRPSQIAFNRALKRLRKAKDRLAETKTRQDHFKEEFLRKVQPIIEEHSRVLLEWILVACDWCETTQKGVGVEVRESFIGLILDTARNIEEHRGGIPDEEFLKMRERVERLIESEDGDDDEDGDIFGLEGTDAGNEDEFKRAMLGMMEEMLRAEGLDIDLSDLDPDDFAAMEARAEEALARGSAKRKPRKRSAKQIAAEEDRRRLAREKEEAKLRDFKSLFKNLAKSMHPDLVTDPEAKAHREQWMKRLTSAYETRDLHSLLTIEMEWLGSESKDLEAASDQKLAVYTELLREQALEAEDELRRLEFDDPARGFDQHGYMRRVSAAEIAGQIKREMKDSIKEITILRAGGKGAKALVRELTRPRREMW